MQEDHCSLDLVILISERYAMLKKKCEAAWNERSEMDVSASEWYLLSHVVKNPSSVSGIARLIDITRQAAHKGLKSLELKGLVKILDMPENKRDKQVMLTPTGERCYAEYEAVIAVIEGQIADTLGPSNLLQLKTLLEAAWD